MGSSPFGQIGKSAFTSEFLKAAKTLMHISSSTCSETRSLQVYRLFTDGSVTLVVFEQWLEKKLKQYFNPIADIILADKQKLSSKKLINASFGEEVTTEVNDETNIQGNNLYQNTSKQSVRALKYWICEQSHRLMQCSSFIDKTAPERK